MQFNPRSGAAFTALLVVMLVIAGAPRPAAAQSQGEPQGPTLEDLMKTTVTTASRHAEGIGEAPAQIVVITAREIRARGYRSLGELLRDQLGIKVELGTDPDYPSDLTIQGSRNTSRVVLLMDGIRVGSPTAEPLPIMANYPVHAARQVEILFGPASALYGADAFSAVINVITKDANELDRVAGSISVGQFGMTSSTVSVAERIGEQGSIVVAGQVFRDGQADLSRYYPEQFEGMQSHQRGTFESIFGSMAPVGHIESNFQSPVAAHSMSAHLNIRNWRAFVFNSTQRASTSAPYTSNNAVYNDTAFQQNDLWVGSLDYTRELREGSTTTSVTVSRHELNPQSGYWNVFSNFRKSFKYAYGAMLRGAQSVELKFSPKVRLAAGGAYERYFAIPQGADLNTPVASHNTPGTILDTAIVDPFVKMHYTNVGAYAQLQFAAGARASFTVGTRADHNSLYGSTVNPRVGAVLKPTETTTVKVLFGTAFLAPSPYQSNSHYGAFYSEDGGQTYASDFWHLGNPDLTPQKKQTWQITATQSLGPLFNVSATAYTSHIYDVLKHADPDRAGPGTYLGWPVAYIEFPVNEGVEEIHGAMAQGMFLKSWSSALRLQADAGISVVGGNVTDDDNGTVELGAIAPFQFHAGADLEWNNWTASGRLMQFGRQRVLALTPARRRETLPGFTLVDVNLRRNRITRTIDAFLRIENLFDARHVHINERAFTNAEELVGAPQAPRRVSFGIDVRIGR